ncbi:unnamed protein product [Meganyctiphanes norvegica]|uniref:Uncharacterized protein n=1 Tax=Meganyctiphanes norvegica TaxID=48144 RepID=A0AAV2QBJ0_MEGNR
MKISSPALLLILLAYFYGPVVSFAPRELQSSLNTEDVSSNTPSYDPITGVVDLILNKISSFDRYNYRTPTFGVTVTRKKGTKTFDSGCENGLCPRIITVPCSCQFERCSVLVGVNPCKCDPVFNCD